ncbi:aldo-keto reductase [Arthrobacter crystallopoietes BAB-32]|uniref:Aldo-keto reductase n=1 Tax=Arthrobacter crystallopoietes BAB-32 TaxID=1246476 RepID=N1V8M9_9MICC|nr:aldo/keto reductase [Arthrobacter crystallopoietes]EMY34608.1 aldo-keto reductase [Arthrobacter crystallopoietes BAB-32]
MDTRRIGTRDVGSIGLGCMNLSHAYGVPPVREDAEALLLHALDRGVRHFDTAAIYGATANETLVGEVLGPRRDEYFLASKGGMTSVDGKRVIDGRPHTLKATCEEALRRLRTDHIDLYYLHRWDKTIPVEESVGALAELVAEGKIGGIGLSEVSADTLRRAHTVHPIAALQTEYSLWTRNPELGVLSACRELGTAFVAFSPLARGFLTGKLRDPSALPEGDLRRGMPRFSPANFPLNLRLLDGYTRLAEEAGCTPAQLALAWVLHQDGNIIALPGTTNSAHLDEDLAAAAVVLDENMLQRLDGLINEQTVHGARYNAAAQADVDTETFGKPEPAE